MSNVPTLKKLIAGEVSLKDAIDYAEAKVIEQGVPALDNYRCTYLNDNNQKCVVGHLITDEDHAAAHDKIQGSVGVVLTRFDYVFDTKKFINERYISILKVLRAMQGAHDDREIREDFVNGFKAYMADIRAEYADIIAQY